jgi:hypothetical protein
MVRIIGAVAMLSAKLSLVPTTMQQASAQGIDHLKIKEQLHHFLTSSS